jgi:hypothetical protein
METQGPRRTQDGQHGSDAISSAHDADLTLGNIDALARADAEDLIDRLCAPVSTGGCCKDGDRRPQEEKRLDG